MLNYLHNKYFIQSEDLMQQKYQVTIYSLFLFGWEYNRSF